MRARLYGSVSLRNSLQNAHTHAYIITKNCLVEEILIAQTTVEGRLAYSSNMPVGRTGKVAKKTRIHISNTSICRTSAATD